MFCHVDGTDGGGAGGIGKGDGDQEPVGGQGRTLIGGFYAGGIREDAGRV